MSSDENRLNIIQELRNRLNRDASEKNPEGGGQFLIPEQLRPPPGLATGIRVFDDFLLWRGLPQGELSLLYGKPGTGATSLWLQAASQVHTHNKWVAWVNSDCDLLPSPHLQKKLRLNRLLVVKKTQDLTQLFWVLQEMMASQLFEMIGCHLPKGLFRPHQMQKLKRLARLHQVALVFISHLKTWTTHPLFSLVIDCHRDFFTVQRALHRPTPFTISGSMIYADLMPELEHHTGGVLC